MTSAAAPRLISDMRGSATARCSPRLRGTARSKPRCTAPRCSTTAPRSCGRHSTQPYVERYVNRGAVFFFDAGKPVHELVNPDGLAYVMQACCIGVDPTLTEGDLSGLGTRLALPEGWTFRTPIFDEELVVDTSATIATVVQDELENTYTLPS